MLGFHRSRSDRVVAGVAGGLGAQLGVDPVVLRIVFVALSFAGAAGIVLYLVAWALVPEETDATRAPERPVDLRQAVAVGLVSLGVLLLLREVGLWLGDALVWPVVVAAAGSAVIWARGTDEDRARWSRFAARIPGNPVDSVFAGPVSVPRVVVGGLLIAGGLGAFVATTGSSGALVDVLVAVVATLAGGALVFGPWAVRLGQQLGSERRERIRQEERAEVAAHLHDSVLQTLALIQRSADQPRRMVALARRQERELRAWLYGQREELAATDELRAALDAVVEEVEAVHDVAVEVVVVGDAPVDERVRALLAATREALVNAAKHADVRDISLFLEARADGLEVFVRDRGRGFDPARVPADRHGIRASIEGRMRRHGGAAEVWSEPGTGTEVTLTLPIERSEP